MKPDPSPDMSGTITRLLDRARGGDELASDELFQVVYSELRDVARRMVTRGMSSQPALEGTELVHAACERLLGKCGLDAENRRHFFFLFGRAMRDVLVEQARADGSKKRGGRYSRSHLFDIPINGEWTRTEIHDIRAAVDALRIIDSDAAQVVELRFFAGKTIEETAELLNSSKASVRRNWEYARAWLSDHLSNQS